MRHTASFGELDQLASPPTCFYRKISTETPIETKQNAFQSEFNRERKGRALGKWSNCPTRQMGDLDDSFGPTRRTGRLDDSFGPTFPVRVGYGKAEHLPWQVKVKTASIRNFGCD
ncbi:hypothetical protein F2Q70_00002844 [Brassica cretica]|uniref:Uncharacterized protein n=1 Tax=Brassica cretica TaxID=69181 RepID=A0A8S9J1V7_BRACR|nr:hypothetical protein F2Q70_00002844 [Brassica cretica]